MRLDLGRDGVMKEQIRTARNVRRLALIIFDIFSIAAAGFGALFLRFNGSIERKYLENFTDVILPVVVIGIIVFTLFRLYHSLWQFASIAELVNLVYASVLCSAVYWVVCEISGNGMPRSCYFIFFLILTMLLCVSRFCYRLIRRYRQQLSDRRLGAEVSLERVMIVGAGAAGEKVYREIAATEELHKKVCLLYTSRCV